MYEIKANLSGNIWSVALKSATVKQQLESRRIDAADMRLMRELRFFESTMLQDVELKGWWSR